MDTDRLRGLASLDHVSDAELQAWWPLMHRALHEALDAYLAREHAVAEWETLLRLLFESAPAPERTPTGGKVIALARRGRRRGDAGHEHERA